MASGGEETIIIVILVVGGGAVLFFVTEWGAITEGVNNFFSDIANGFKWLGDKTIGVFKSGWEATEEGAESAWEEVSSCFGLC